LFVAADQRETHQQAADPGAPDRGAPGRSWFGAVTRALNLAGTLLILIMAVAVNADIIGRDFFNHPLPGVLEFIGLSIVAVVFLQMANTLREDRHVSNDILVVLIKQSHPRVVALLYMIFNLIGAALMALIAWFVWPLLEDAYVRGYYSGTAEVVEIPIWPFMAVVIVGAIVTAVQFLTLAMRQFRIATTVGARP
jgi:TRAP-type mannitol/chloroaromatic compound transport system permease small subunit